MANDCLALVNEHTIHTEAYTMETPRLDEALKDLESEFFIDRGLLDKATRKGQARFNQRNKIYHDTVRFSPRVYVCRF